VNISVATGSRVIHISGQTTVDAEGKVVGSTYLDQARQAFRNLSAALAPVSRFSWLVATSRSRLARGRPHG
jgi:enamine deaminase RidA (YjgF/YER057c/UK114 family)